MAETTRYKKKSTGGRLAPLSGKKIAPYVFSAPFVLFYILFLAFPILFTFYEPDELDAV